MKKQPKQSGLDTTHLDWNQNQQAELFQSPASPLFVLPKNHINQVRSKRRAQIAPAFVSLHRSQTHLISSERPCQAAHIILLPQQRFYCSGSGRGSRSWTIQLGFNSFRLWVAACLAKWCYVTTTHVVWKASFHFMEPYVSLSRGIISWLTFQTARVISEWLRSTLCDVMQSAFGLNDKLLCPLRASLQ